MSKYCIGIDLGGSFIKVGLLDDQRHAGKPMEFPTPQKGAESVVKGMADAARALMVANGLTNANIVGVGIGSPGPLSMARGIILETPNIPGMTFVPVRDMITEYMGLPAVLENDANAAGFGEFISRDDANIMDLVFLTLGTGVGGGIVVDGQVIRGGHEIGAELGHMIVRPGGEPCNCGQRGCLERYASATYMSLRAQKMIEAGRQSILGQTLKVSGTINSKDVNDARKQGDGLAAEVWDDMAQCLGIACVTIARMLDPDEILLGGGMAKAGQDLLEPVQKHYEANHWTITKRMTRIGLSKMGNDAGFIGAAGVAWAAFGKQKN